MKKFAVTLLVFAFGYAGVVLLCLGADVDKRGLNAEFPVWRKSITQMSFDSNSTAEKTEDIIINGTIEQICIRSTYGASDPDITITVDDDLTNELYNSGAVDCNNNYVYTLADFLPTANNFPVVGTITIGVDPNLDPNGMTVDIDIYGR